MAIPLRQSTAVTLIVGRFVDSADGVTPETALTITQADVRLSKNWGSWAQKNDASSCTHQESGFYSCPLNTTDTNTLGPLLLAVNESGAVPVEMAFHVIPQQVYDSLFAGTDVLQVHTNELTTSIAQAVADEVLNRDIAGGASGGARNVRSAMRLLRNRRAIAGGSLTVYQEDDATPAWTAAVTTAAGNPVTQIDP